MRTLKLAERQENLKNLIDMMKPLKLNFGTLPTIAEKEQNQNHLKIKSWQQSPKIFINTEQALIWIKKGIQKKNRHDLFEMIKKKAEKELTLEKATYLKTKERRSKRNLSHTLRKYSSTSRCPAQNKVNRPEISQFNLTQNLEQKKQSSHFLRIKVLQTLPPPSSKVNVKSRIRTEKSKNQTISFCGKDKPQKSQKKSIRVGSEGKFFKRKPPTEDSFNTQFLTPW